MAGEKNLEIRIENKILFLTLNRPDVRNAFTEEMNTQMAGAILSADYDAGIAMVAITGAGDKAFCSGADMNEARRAADAGEVFRGPLHTTTRGLFEVMIDSQKPIMAIIFMPSVNRSSVSFQRTMPDSEKIRKPTMAPMIIESSHNWTMNAEAIASPATSRVSGLYCTLTC